MDSEPKETEDDQRKMDSEPDKTAADRRRRLARKRKQRADAMLPDEASTDG